MTAPAAKLSARDEAIAQRTAAIVLASMKDVQLASVLTETIGPEQLQVMLGTNSKSATYRQAAKLGIVAYEPGKYRLKHVQDRIAQRSYAATARHKSAA